MGNSGCVRFWIVVFIYGPCMTFGMIAVLILFAMSTAPNPNLLVGISEFVPALVLCVLSAWGARFLMMGLRMSSPAGCEKNLLIGLVLIACVVIGGRVGYNWVQNNYVPKNEFVDGSAWQGQEDQYHAVVSESDMSLTVDTVKNGTFSATVQWPVLNTITYAEGVIVTNISDKRWTYVIHPDSTLLKFTECTKGAVYLQFTETAYIQGNSVSLNASYYAIACGDNISGVWFWPNKPNAGPGGEFTLSKQLTLHFTDGHNQY